MAPEQQTPTAPPPGKAEGVGAVSNAAHTGASGDRPNRAVDVELVGEFKGSGFAERQWLVKRGDRFIQLTELLFRIVEHADGTHTLDEISAHVTDCTEWMVTPENVRDLVEARLVPLGLIVSDGSSFAQHGSQTKEHSPFGLAMRMRALRPAAIDRIAKVTQYLFAPPIAIAALVLALAAHVWVYSVHGLTGAFLDALYTPSSLLVVLGVVLVGGVVHEFGHASALRYGGGRARGMGFGLYMIFPAFYTDVTESYRLSRWGRVRTGLGGPFFHLLFAAALIGVSLVSGHEFLLIAVLLINVEIARQFIPFVRLDGYWVLADLTGVPDYLSQMGPFVRSLFPRLAGRGPRLPALKRWVKVVFAAYIALTIPVLVALLILLVRFVPRLMTLLWDAIATQMDFLSSAFAAKDAIGVATAAVELIILALPVLGLAYLLYSLTAKPLRAAVRQPTRRRRAIGLASAAAMIGVLAALWIPQLPFASDAAPLGVKSFAVQSRAHVRGRVVYAQHPPVGGAHAVVWQNCGFYSQPIADENAVHSLEHGAVWLAYRPDLPDADVNVLRRMAVGRTYVLVSPYPGLRSAIVATAWGRQLRVTSTADARLERFVNAFRLSKHAPESGGPCTGGKSDPR
jgi:putative peptide zinc metalloprotease protein